MSSSASSSLTQKSQTRDNDDRYFFWWKSNDNRRHGPSSSVGAAAVADGESTPLQTRPVGGGTGHNNTKDNGENHHNVGISTTQDYYSTGTHHPSPLPPPVRNKKKRYSHIFPNHLNSTASTLPGGGGGDSDGVFFHYFGSERKDCNHASVLPISELYPDPIPEMTYSRRIAHWLSSKCTWYCSPQARPALKDGWWYYERFTLARHEGPSQDPDSCDYFVSANPGELTKPTYLYPVWDTPETDLADFGEGMGIYFYTLRMLTIIFAMAGFISLPNILYFASTQWDANKDLRFQFLQASAVCSNQIWKACPTCTKEQWNFFPASFQSYAEAIHEVTGEKLTFIRTNGCTITRQVGVVALSTMVFVTLAVYILSKIAKYKERVLDYSQQTTKDYSLQIRNPPIDARNAEEWKDFFGQFGSVVSVTSVLDNQELLQKLLERRKLISQLEDMLPSDMAIDPSHVDDAIEHVLPLSCFSKLLGMLSGSEIQKRIHKIDDIILTDLSQRSYDVSEVFVIFDKEADQQLALQKLQLPLIQIYRQNLDALEKPSYAFRGKVVLNVVDPPETSNVIWYHLKDTLFDHLRQRIITFFVTIFFIVLGCAFVVLVKHYHGTLYGALAVSLVTSAAPYICQYIIMYGETHPTEESKQLSLFTKLTAFLWVTATLLTTRISSFQATLDDDPTDLLPSIYAIFITEMLKSPAIQLLDITGNLKKHILAPRAPTLKKMAQYFRGTYYNLSERYTDMCSVVFMAFVYSLLFPAGYFLAAATLAIHYWVDKFCLLRVWAPAPKMGFQIGQISREYFFCLAVIVYAMKSAYDYASFPFDDACALDEIIPETYVGSFNATDGSGHLVSIDITADDFAYKFCNQDVGQFRTFPPILFATPARQPEGAEWMSEEQQFAHVFGICSFWIMAVALFSLCNLVRKHLQILFWRPIANKEWSSPRTFSAIEDESGYIPSATIDTEMYPILFCNVSDLPPTMMSWVDPEHPDYRIHCALFDIPGLDKRPCFSTVHYWPSMGQEKTVPFLLD